jgi:amphi-Trp domain-containing protein
MSDMRKAISGVEDAEEPKDEDALDPDEDSSEPVTQHRAKGKIKFESVMQRGEAAAYFSALVDGLRHGKLQFRHEDESLSLQPSEQVSVEVKAQKKGDKEKISFELEWKVSARKPLEVAG